MARPRISFERKEDPEDTIRRGFAGPFAPIRDTADLEHDARQALELRAGRTFGDREWAQMRGKLVEFYAILRDWDQEASERERISKAD
jgi:hypothetical protein